MNKRSEIERAAQEAADALPAELAKMLIECAPLLRALGWSIALIEGPQFVDGVVLAPLDRLKSAAPLKFIEILVPGGEN